MNYSQVVIAAVLAAAVVDASAESIVLQDARRVPWVLAAPSAASPPAAPAVSPESADIGWLRSSDLKPGGSLQLEVAKDWAVCADWDRQRPKTQVRETIDTFLLGLYYRF